MSSAPEEDKGSEESKIDEVAALLRFYFGDANLRRDRFLRKEILKDPQGCECPKQRFHFP